MKNNIKSLVDAHVSDSKQFITGNVAEHLILEAQSMENGFYFFLTDDEITEYEKANSDRKSEMEKEIVDFINENYDYSEEKYYIIDTTSNSASIAYVMDESGEIIHTSENCMSFDSEEEAKKLITKNNWDDWAGVIRE